MAVVFALPPMLMPLRRSCATSTCDEHCAHCRENDRLAAERMTDGWWHAVQTAIATSIPLKPVAGLSFEVAKDQGSENNPLVGADGAAGAGGT